MEGGPGPCTMTFPREFRAGAAAIVVVSGSMACNSPSLVEWDGEAVQAALLCYTSRFELDLTFQGMVAWGLQ